MFVASKKLYYTILCTFLLITTSLYSSNLDIPFIPPVYNYTTNNYKAGNQNWAIAQGANGVIYFGNNNGLLSFDGVNWVLHSLPNDLSVKSIFIDNKSITERIYVGSFEEFGFFERNESGQLSYHSIKERVTDYNFHNDEIWSILSYKGKIYFQSFSRIFAYDDNNIEIIDPNPAVLYFFPMGGKIFAQLINSGLSIFNGVSFEEIIDRSSINNDDIVSMLQMGDEYLLATSKNGLYKYSEKKGKLTPWVTEIDDDLGEAIINRAIMTDSSQFIIGTINKGIYALNNNGEVLWNIDRNNGLINNTVLALLSDKHNNLWVALDNGIANIRTESAFTIFEPKNIQIGLVEEILNHNNNLYLATNQGVYFYSQPDNTFAPIPELDVQSWFIKSFGDQIFIGHNFGTAVIENGRVTEVSGANTGGMDMKQATINGQNILLEATYTSLYIYKQNNIGVWTFSHAVEGFSDLIKNIEIDHTGNLWAGHMYKGIYRIKLDEDLKKISEIENIMSLTNELENPLPNINIMKLKGRIIFTDGVNFYTFDDINQKITLFDLLNENLSELADTYRIVAINNNHYWFIRDKEYTLVSFENDKYRVKDHIPFSILNNPPNVGRANIYVSERGTSYFSLNGGIGKYTLRDEETAKDSNTVLQFSSIRFFSRDSEEYNFLNPETKGEIDFGYNNLEFRFTYPEFSKKSFKVETFLEGYDNRWISSDENLFISYSNLPAGDYILNARITDCSKNELSTLTYYFRIKNPWYKTGYAYLSYIFIILVISGLISKNHIQKTIRKKSELFAEQENKRLIQIEQQERQINKLRTEKLESDLTYKGKELASATMMIINHAEFLKKLNSQIQQYTLDGKINKLESRTLQNMIGENISYEDEWSVFQENFDLIHENFFRNLKEKFPTLTPSDLKLCTLLRLNYSTKEIARLLNISTRGVESARYRLRKKLMLEESDNLIEFLIKFR